MDGERFSSAGNLYVNPSCWGGHCSLAVHHVSHDTPPVLKAIKRPDLLGGMHIAFKAHEMSFAIFKYT